MSRRNNCMFLLPHELTGLGECCGLFGACNGYGKRCVAYQPHTAESRKALAEAIAKRKEDFPRTPRGRENNKPNNKENSQ